MNDNEFKAELSSLFKKIKNNKTPTHHSAVYLSEGLYLLENGEVVEEEKLL
jgi:hypothetical protein